MTTTTSEIRSSAHTLLYHAWMFKESIGGLPPTMKDECGDTCYEIEAIIYRECEKDMDVYMKKMRDMASFFIQCSTEELKQLRGWDNLVKLDSQSLLQLLSSVQKDEPYQWSLLVEKSKVHENLQTVSQTGTCHKCKSIETEHYQKQTRSADEPMTTFFRCLQCGNQWILS